MRQVIKNDILEQFDTNLNSKNILLEQKCFQLHRNNKNKSKPQSLYLKNTNPIQCYKLDLPACSQDKRQIQ